MARPCSVCAHPKRDKIDAALLKPGTRLREIAEKYGLSISAVHRHKESHMPTAAIAKHVEQEQRRGESLADFWLDLRKRAERIADDAKKEKDRRGESAAVQSLTKLLDLGLKAATEFKAQGANAPLDQHPEFAHFVATLCSSLAAKLAEHPEALAALRDAIAETAAAA